MTILDTSWKADAACQGIFTDLFFSNSGGKNADAKEICGGCPVRLECLNYALQIEDNSGRHGIYGGLTPDERSRLYKKQATTPTSDRNAS